VLQSAVNGLLLGSVYALLTVGYSLVFGVTRLLTLAHGEVFMVSGALALLGMRAFDLPLALAILIAVAVGAGAGVLTDLLCFRPVSRQSHLAPAVATIGLALALQSSLVLWRGSAPIGLPANFQAADIHIGSLLVSTPELAMFVLAVVLMAGFAWFIRTTRWGAALRAMGEDPATLELLGINARGLATIVLGVSGMLAGLAGILSAVRIGRISPYAGTEIALKGLAIMAIAGLGSLPGAMAVGVAIGMVEVFSDYYQLSGMGEAIPWILVVAVLLLRPRGLFSRSRSS
jgi:branched-chain amino acid transport system permease protein